MNGADTPVPFNKEPKATFGRSIYTTISGGGIGMTPYQWSIGGYHNFYMKTNAGDVRGDAPPTNEYFQLTSNTWDNVTVKTLKACKRYNANGTVQDVAANTVHGYQYGSISYTLVWE